MRVLSINWKCNFRHPKKNKKKRDIKYHQQWVSESEREREKEECIKECLTFNNFWAMQWSLKKKQSIAKKEFFPSHSSLFTLQRYVSFMLMSCIQFSIFFPLECCCFCVLISKWGKKSRNVVVVLCCVWVSLPLPANLIA